MIVNEGGRMAQEKERTKRVYVNFPVKIGGLIDATALDLSLEGIFIATDEHIARGDEIIINIGVDGIDLELHAWVLFTIAGWGFGARFLGRKPEQMRLLEVLMESQQIGEELSDDDERSKPTILIIDDSEQYWKLKLPNMERIYNVIKVEDGEEGLNVLKQAPVDLVISELKNRRADAFRILQLMEVHPKIQSPLLVLTRLYRPSDRKLLKKRGAVGFFDKLKTSQEKLIAKINEILLA